MYSNRIEANRAVFDDIAKPQILRRGKVNYQDIYENHFLPAFLKLELPFEAISEKTFYVYKDKYIDPDEKVAAQQGRVAAKHAKLSKNAKFSGDGFTSLVEVDCFHEPIALLDPITFKPTGVRPIHYLALEVHTGVYPATVTDYKNGCELSSYVVEMYKRMFFPKPDFQSIYGTKNSFKQYCKPYQIIHDGGTAYTAGVCGEFLAFSNTCKGIAKTQEPTDKCHVEAGNFSIKTGFTLKLPGSYNDKQKGYIDPKPYSKFAVLTTLEHEVLFNRFICDDRNHGYDKRRGFNRAEQWAKEAALFPPVLPSNPAELINFMGLRDTKKIQKVVGIQFHVRGTPHTFNSDKLQKLRRVLLQQKKTDEVTYHRSDFFPDCIRVVNPINDEILVVPRIQDEYDSDITYVGDGEFYAELAALQRIELLATMTYEEIITAAKKRKRKIERYEQDKKHQRARDAKALDEVFAEDTKELERLIAQQSLDEELPQEDETDESSESQEKADEQLQEEPESSEPNNTQEPNKGWDKPNLFNKNSKD
jgi:hypothetical protein